MWDPDEFERQWMREFPGGETPVPRLQLHSVSELEAELRRSEERLRAGQQLLAREKFKVIYLQTVLERQRPGPRPQPHREGQGDRPQGQADGDIPPGQGDGDRLLGHGDRPQGEGDRPQGQVEGEERALSEGDRHPGEGEREETPPGQGERAQIEKVHGECDPCHWEVDLNVGEMNLNQGEMPLSQESKEDVDSEQDSVSPNPSLPWPSCLRRGQRVNRIRNGSGSPIGSPRLRRRQFLTVPHDSERASSGASDGYTSSEHEDWSSDYNYTDAFDGETADEPKATQEASEAMPYIDESPTMSPHLSSRAKETNNTDTTTTESMAAMSEVDPEKRLEMRNFVLSGILASEEIYLNQLEALLLV